MRRFLGSFLVLIVLVAAASLGWWLLRGGRLSLPPALDRDSLERWCAEQVEYIANDLLRPEFVLANLDYTYPATLTLHDVRLIDEGIDVVRAPLMRIELAELPKRGAPVIIKSIELENPVLRFIASKEGGLVGYRDMVASKDGHVRDDGASSRPSDVFAIRQISVTDGTLSWEPADVAPMRFEGISGKLGTQPRQSEPGTYAIDLDASRGSLTTVRLQGELQIDEAWLQIDSCEATLAISPDNYDELPPTVQAALQARSVRGKLDVDVKGHVPFSASAGPLDLDFGARLGDTYVAFGEYQLPIESLAVDGGVKESNVHIDRLDAEMLRGKVHATGTVESGSVEAQIHGEGLRIEDVLRHASDEPPRLAGSLTMDISGRTGLADFPRSTRAQGSSSVVDGYLVGNPVIGGLMGMLHLNAGSIERGQDHGTSDVEFVGDLARLRKIDVVSGTMAVRGEGEILYDGTLNLRLNAGPLERAQRALGPVGDVLGALTDTLVKYEVSGPIDAPAIRVAPFGAGTEETRSTAADPDEGG